MSKRLQVLVQDHEYKKLKDVSRRQNKTVATWVRENLHLALARDVPEDPDSRIARILRFAKYSAPTGDIDQILNEIEKGYSES